MNIEKLDGKKIDIFGDEYTICIVDHCEGDNEKYALYGETSGADYTITVARYVDDIRMTNEQMQLTFCHELMHAMVGSGCYNDYNEDESFIEWMGKCLNSLIKKKFFNE